MFDTDEQLELIGAGFFMTLVAIGKLEARLDGIEKKINHLHQMENRIMADLTDLTAQVSANTSAEQAAIVLLNDLSVRIAASATDPAALADLSNQLRNNAAELGAAVVANTPAADTPPVDTPPADSPPVSA